MTVALRYLRPEKRCQHPLNLCGAYRRLLEHSISEMNELSSMTGLRTPDWELVVDCRSFCAVVAKRTSEDDYSDED